MKNIISIICFVILTHTLCAQSVNKGNLIFIHTERDTNTLKSNDTLATDMFYIIDGDESKGEVILTFNLTENYKEAYLIVNIPDREWAETNDGFDIFLKDKKVASISSAARNSWLEIKLDHTLLPASGTVEFTLRSIKNDGLYICSKKSGKGAVLKVVQ